jgi:hypothetical protein
MFFVSLSHQTNTFQCVLVGGYDGIYSYSFAIFLYADGLIQWTTGDDSGGSGGLGGWEARVGFNLGSFDSYPVPGSGTPEIINITLTSNVGRAGMWVFHLDGEDSPIMSADCHDSGEWFMGCSGASTYLLPLKQLS